MALLDTRSAVFAPPPARIAGAAWSTVLLHLATLLTIAWIVARPQPLSRDSLQVSPPQVMSFALPGLSGGRDNSEPQRQPPARAQRVGTARTTTLSRVPPSFTATENPAPVKQDINVPHLPKSSSGLNDVPGVLTATWASVGISTGLGPGDGGGPGRGRGSGSNVGDGPGGPGTNVSPPELLVQVRPNYTPGALQARIRGVVTMEAVVEPDGSIGDVRILRSLDRTFGLDLEAIKAVKRWRFRPATRLGKAVPMYVNIEMTFELR